MSGGIGQREEGNRAFGRGEEEEVADLGEVGAHYYIISRSSFEM